MPLPPANSTDTPITPDQHTSTNDNMALELADYMRSLDPPPQIYGAPLAAGVSVNVINGMLVVGWCSWHIPPAGFGLLALLEMASFLRVPVAWLARGIQRASRDEGVVVGVWVEAVCNVL